MSKPKIIIYTTSFCPYCENAKHLLKQKGLSYEEIAVDKDPVKREEMVEKSGRMSVPQIFINDKHIGGYDDLSALNSQGGLDKILNNKE